MVLDEKEMMAAAGCRGVTLDDLNAVADEKLFKRASLLGKAQCCLILQKNYVNIANQWRDTFDKAADAESKRIAAIQNKTFCDLANTMAASAKSCVAKIKTI